MVSPRFSIFRVSLSVPWISNCLIFLDNYWFDSGDGSILGAPWTEFCMIGSLPVPILPSRSGHLEPDAFVVKEESDWQMDQLRSSERRHSMTYGTLPAVHDDDLREYLESLGLLADLEAERLRCKLCGDAVSLLNLHALFPDSGTIGVICDRADCIKKLVRNLWER